MGSTDIALADFVGKMTSYSPANRLRDDFVPAPDPAAKDPLLKEALLSFKTDYVEFSKKKDAESYYAATDIEDPPKCKYRIDSRDERGLKSKPKKEQRKALADVFKGADGAAPADAAPVEPEDAKPADDAAASPEAGDAEEGEDEKDEGPLNLDAKSIINPKHLFDNPLEVSVAKMQEVKSNFVREDPFFWRFRPDYTYPGALSEIICERRPVKMWRQPKVTKVLVTCGKLRFGEFDQVEPLFCSIYLYDLSRGLQVSEKFYYDYNPLELLTANLLVHKQCAAKSNMGHHAIFNVSDAHENVVLVVKIERVLMGDPDPLNEYYQKEKKAKKDVTNAQTKAAQSVARLFRYRQAFLWSIIPIFNDTGNVMYETEEQIVVRHFFVQKEPMDDPTFTKTAQEKLAAMRDTSASLKKKAIFDFSTTFRMQEVEEDVLKATVYDASGQLLKEASEDADMALPEVDPEVKSDDSAVVREIRNLAGDDEVPVTQFENLLFVFPETVGFSKHRNIAVKTELRLDDAASEEAQQVIFGRSSDPDFVTESVSIVSYHNHNPVVKEEVKIKLPLKLTSKAHLFFTFYQINCKAKPGKPCEEVVGHAVLPLFYDGRIIEDGTHVLGIANPGFKSPYLANIAAGVAVAAAAGGSFAGVASAVGKDIEWLTGSSEKFHVTIRKFSSVFCDDSYFMSLFNAIPKMAECKDEEQLSNMLAPILHQWRNAYPQSFLRFLVPSLNFLLKIVGGAPFQIARVFAFRAANVMIDGIRLHLNEKGFRTSCLSAYVEYIFQDFGIPNLYQALAEQLKIGLADSTSAVDEDSGPGSGEFSHLVITNSWFWFDVITKALLCNFHKNGGKASTVVAEFPLTLKGILELIVQFMFCHRQGVGLTALKRLNQCFALFLCDLFRVVDRSVVMSLICSYLDRLEAKSDTVLLQFKTTFLQIILDNNLLVDILKPSVVGEVIKKKKKENTIIQTISEAFPLIDGIVKFVQENIQETSSKPMKTPVILVLRNLLLKFDYDIKVGNETRKALATAFLPILSMICLEADTIKKLLPIQQRSLYACFVWVIRHADADIIIWWLAEELEERTSAAAFYKVLLESLKTFEYAGIEVRKNATDEFDSILAFETTASFVEGGDEGSEDYKANIENIMSGFLNANRSASLKKRGTGVGSLTSTGSGTLGSGGVTSPTLAASTSGRASRGSSVSPPTVARPTSGSLGVIDKSGTGGKKTGTGGGGTSKRKLYLEQRQAFMAQQSSLRKTKKGTAGKGTLTLNDDSMLSRLVTWEGNLNVTTSFSILAITLKSLFELEKQKKLADVAAPIWDEIADLMVGFLKYQQGDDVYIIVYHVIRFFLRLITLPESVSGQHLMKSTHYVSSLCQAILRHCTFSVDEMRSCAISLLYLTARASSKISGTFDVFQEAVTFSLSNNVQRLKGNGALYLKQSFEAAVLLESSGTKQFEDVMHRVTKIYEDTLEIARQDKLGDSADLAVIEDLYMDMADQYSHLPEVRRDWLSQLTAHHLKCENYAESAQAALEQVKLLNTLKSAKALSEVDIENLIDGLYAQSVDSLDKALLYEECNKIYMESYLPILNSRKMYSKMQASYSHLSSVIERLIKAEETKYRMLGTYYRVGFYGDKFGNMNGNQYIYKRPKITQLSEVVTYLKEKYGAQTKETIHIVPTSAHVESKDFKPEECHIQITFVQPYFEGEELIKRKTFIEKNTNLKRFTFSTPFSKGGGKAISSDITQQCMKITILTVANPFPYTKTRQKVVKYQEIELSPVASARDNINRRIEQFENVLAEEEPQKQLLASLLQGSILLQVHGGVQEICNAFFKDEKSTEGTDPEELNSLRETIEAFIRTCEAALVVFNRIANDETDGRLKVELEKHFAKMQTEMWPILKKKAPGKKKVKKGGVRFAED